MKTAPLFSALIAVLGVGTGSAGTIRSANSHEDNDNHADEQHHDHRQLQELIARNDTYSVLQANQLDVPFERGLLVNDTATGTGDVFVTNFLTWGIFVGTLDIDINGAFRYDPPNADFIGEEQFTYEVCQGASASISRQALTCASANVTISVLRDPNRPRGPPFAQDDTYVLKEGETLSVSSPGFLSNDSTENGQPIYRESRRKADNFEGELSTNADGSFRYESEDCWTGDDFFWYTACYINYPDLCDEGKVTVRVEQDNNRRPASPYARNDQYTVREGEELDVNENDGILSNDSNDKGQRLYVEDEDEDNGFEGSLDVSSDGSFTYKPEAGKLGSFWFEYEVCYEDWPCVSCQKARVEIKVETNPNKPNNPPTANDDSYSTTQGVDLDVSSSLGVLANDVGQSPNTLYVDDYEYNGDGDLDVDSDGSFEYEPDSDFEGSETFTYKVCYNEWPDICSTGTATITVRAPAPPGDGGTPRRGVATAYQVRWDASDDEAEDCDSLSPSLMLQCGADGELSLLDVEPSDNSECVLNDMDGIIRCNPRNEGVIYVECRDGPSSNDTRRELITTMTSDAVACTVDDSELFHMSWTYHAMSLQTWCRDPVTNEDQWTNKGMECSSGKVLERETNTGSPLCYEDSVSSGTSSQPPAVTMTATGYEQCLFETTV